MSGKGGWIRWNYDTITTFSGMTHYMRTGGFTACCYMCEDESSYVAPRGISHATYVEYGIMPICERCFEEMGG